MPEKKRPKVVAKDTSKNKVPLQARAIERADAKPEPFVQLPDAQVKPPHTLDDVLKAAAGIKVGSIGTVENYQVLDANSFRHYFLTTPCFAAAVF
jgi:hypothetical protein